MSENGISSHKSERNIGLAGLKNRKYQIISEGRYDLDVMTIFMIFMSFCIVLGDACACQNNIQCTHFAGQGHC